jgi:hypothetical protein
MRIDEAGNQQSIRRIERCRIARSKSPRRADFDDRPGGHKIVRRVGPIFFDVEKPPANDGERTVFGQATSPTSQFPK